MAWIVRPATPEDGPAIQLIERLGGEQFRSLGMPEIADEEVEPLETLARFAEDGRSWVALHPGSGAVGYVLTEVVDGEAYVHQVTVDPEFQGRGLGRALVEAVTRWADELGVSRILLTTFDSHVPWNRPLYEHLGFVVLAEDELGPQLRAIRDAEDARGLTGRVAMSRPIDRSSS